MGAKLPAVLAATALFSQGGCFSPSFRDGQFTCGPEEACPEGFECYGGQCLETAPDYDAAVAPTVDATPVLTDASQPDAVPAVPSRWYEYDDGPETWSSIPAADLFAGTDAPLPGEVRAAWSHCYGGIETLCFATLTGWKCTNDEGAQFFGSAWSLISAEIAADPPTHIVRFFDGLSSDDANEVLFSFNEKWWLFRYADRPLAVGGGVYVLTPVSDHVALGGYDELWSGEADAPPNPDMITASFTSFHTNRRWTLWDPDGTEYSFRRNFSEWENPEFSKLLEHPGSPDPALVLGATRCMDRLYVLTRSSN